MADTAPPPGFDEELKALQASPTTAAAAPTAAAPTSAEPPPGFDAEMKELKYGGLGQQALAGIEGAAEGVAGPFAPALELASGLTTREDIRGREEVNSGTKTVGELAGLLSPVGEGALLTKAGEAAVKGIGVAEKAGFLAKTASGAAKAAFEGGIYQAGKEVSDIVKSDPQAAAEFSLADVGVTAALSGLFGGAFGAAAAGINKAKIEAAPFLADLQERAGAKALGFNKSQLSKLKGGIEEAKDVARTLMDAEIDTGEKIFTPLAGPSELSSKVETLRTDAGARMGKVYDKLDEAAAPGVNPLDLAAKIDAKIGDFWRSPINKGETNQLENVLESVLMRGDKDISFREAQTLKEEIKKVAYPGGKSPFEPSPRVQIAQDAYKIVSETIDEAVSKGAKELGDGALLKELQTARKQYAAAKKAGRALADRVSSEQGNKLFGLTDTIAGSVLSSGVGLGAAGAAVALKKLAEKYGASTLASTRGASVDKFISAFGSTEAANASKLAKATENGINTARKAVSSVFDVAKEMPSKVIPIAAHRDKLARIVEEHVKAPDKIFAVNDNNPVDQYHAPYATASANAVAYLNSVKPDTNPKNPMDARQPANDVEKAKYNRALDIAQQPLSVLNHIKQGTLLPSDIQAMQAMYPGLYSQLQQQLTSQMIDHMSKGKAVPYTTRMGLSMFIGQPLDSTMTPQAIISAQPKPQEQPQQQGQGNPPPASSVKALGKSPSLYKTPGQAAEQGGANRTK